MAEQTHTELGLGHTQVRVSAGDGALTILRRLEVIEPTPTSRCRRCSAFSDFSFSLTRVWSFPSSR